ncbi:MAG: recombinase family protein [Rhizobiaceae bacterium]
MKPCVGYIRVSTQKQGEGASLDAQKDAIIAFAANHNLEMIGWYQELETAAKRGRPVFSRMLRDLKRGKARGLIMHKIDRSARNLRDWAIVSELPDIGIDVYIATETLDFRSRGGRLTADIQAVIAADYIRNLREETIKGLDGRLKQGLYPFRAPIGYCDTGRGQPKSICPIKGPLVRQAFDLYAQGSYSLRKLEIEMARRGLTNHAGKPLTLHGIETLLANPFYCGHIIIKRTGAHYHGVHKPLIPSTLFRRIQAIKAGRAGKKSTRHDHLYRGLFRCGYCDRPMSPERQKGFTYYRCHGPGCSTKTVRQEAIDTAIHAELQRLSLTPAQETKLRARFTAWVESKERLANIASLELRIAKIDGRLDRLTDLLIDGDIDKRQCDNRKRALFLERAELVEAIKEARKNELPSDKLEEFVERMKSLAAFHISLNPSEKRRLVENVFSNRKVVGKSVELEPQNWLLDRQFADLSPMVTHIDTLIELAPKNDNDKRPSQIPQWKYDLKNQRPDDLTEAA